MKITKVQQDAVPVSYLDIRNRLRITMDNDKGRLEQIAEEVCDTLSDQLNVNLVPTTYLVEYGEADTFTGQLPYGPIIEVQEINGEVILPEDYEIDGYSIRVKNAISKITSVQYRAGYSTLPSKYKGLILSAISAEHYGADDLTGKRLKDQIRLLSNKSFAG